MAQRQIRRQPTKRDDAQVEELPAKDAEAEDLKRRTDELLDEIDDLMAEQDAEAFVRGYVQAGGE